MNASCSWTRRPGVAIARRVYPVGSKVVMKNGVETMLYDGQDVSESNDGVVVIREDDRESCGGDDDVPSMPSQPPCGGELPNDHRVAKPAADVLHRSGELHVGGLEGRIDSGHETAQAARFQESYCFFCHGSILVGWLI